MLGTPYPQTHRYVTRRTYVKTTCPNNNLPQYIWLKIIYALSWIRRNVHWVTHGRHARLRFPHDKYGKRIFIFLMPHLLISAILFAELFFIFHCFPLTISLFFNISYLLCMFLKAFHMLCLFYFLPIFLNFHTSFLSLPYLPKYFESLNFNFYDFKYIYVYIY